MLLAPLASNTVSRESDGRLAVLVRITRRGAPIATAPLRLTVSEAERVHAALCHALDQEPAPKPTGDRPASARGPGPPAPPRPAEPRAVRDGGLMERLESSVPYGTAVSAGDTHTLRYELRFPQGAERVWEAVATREGLPGWLAVAEPFVRHEGGVITLRWQNTDEHGNATVAPGRVTGWGPVRLAEYTVDVHGRMRFDLRDEGSEGTRLRFTNEFTGSAASRLDCLAGWHHHFEFLADALDGRPKDWSTWNLDRWRELRADYAAAGQ